MTALAFNPDGKNLVTYSANENKLSFWQTRYDPSIINTDVGSLQYFQHGHVWVGSGRDPLYEVLPNHSGPPGGEVEPLEISSISLGVRSHRDPAASRWHGDAVQLLGQHLRNQLVIKLSGRDTPVSPCSQSLL